MVLGSILLCVATSACFLIDEWYHDFIFNNERKISETKVI